MCVQGEGGQAASRGQTTSVVSVKEGSGQWAAAESFPTTLHALHCLRRQQSLISPANRPQHQQPRWTAHIKQIKRLKQSAPTPLDLWVSGKKHILHTSATVAVRFCNSGPLRLDCFLLLLFLSCIKRYCFRAIFNTISFLQLFVFLLCQGTSHSKESLTFTLSSLQKHGRKKTCSCEIWWIDSSSELVATPPVCVCSALLAGLLTGTLFLSSTQRAKRPVSAGSLQKRLFTDGLIFCFWKTDRLSQQ